MRLLFLESETKHEFQYNIWSFEKHKINIIEYNSELFHDMRNFFSFCSIQTNNEIIFLF